MHRKTSLLVAALAILLSARVLLADVPDYDKQIAPIFTAYCTGCHYADEGEGGLSLESFEGVLAGGKGGVVLVPGEVASSRLLLVLKGGQPVMPPPDSGDAPSAEEIALIEAWIAAGAPGPKGARPDPTILVTPKVDLQAPPRVAIQAADIHPDGKLAALAYHGEARLVDLASHGVVRTFSGIRGSVTDLAFSSDGKLLVIAAGEPGVLGEARLYSVADGKLLQTFTGHADSLYAAALNHDGKLLATGSYDQQIILWDTATGKQLHALKGHNGAVLDLAFHPGGKVLASASADSTIKLWDAVAGTRLDTLSEPLKEQYAVAFSPDGKRLLAGGVDNRIRVWALSPGMKEGSNKIRLSRFGHEGAIIELAFSRDGELLASAGEDRTVRIWDARTVRERRLLEAQPDWPAALAVSPDHTVLLVGRLDGSLAVYNTESGEALPPAKPELASIWPMGVQPTQTVRMRLSGKHLLGATKVEVSGASGAQFKLKLLPAAAARSDQLVIDLTAPKGAVPGERTLVVHTAGGKSNSLKIYVDELPQQLETEPNEVAEAIEPASAPVGYWGRLGARGDTDHFRYAAKKGQTLVCELSANGLASKLNGVLTLLDEAGRVVASNNDFGMGADPLLAYTVPRDGVYTIRVDDLVRSGGAEFYYRLSVGPLQLVTGAFPRHVTVGKPAQVALIGYNLPADAAVQVKADKPGAMPLPASAGYRMLGRITLTAGAEMEATEQEPNNEAPRAAVLAAPVNISGRIDEPGDADLFGFESQAGGQWIIETEAAQHGSPVDTKIEVLGAQGRPVERLLLQAKRDSYITFRSIDSDINDARVKNWEEMELNELMYMQGEVCKIFRMPQGPDSGFRFYDSQGKRRGYFDTSASAHAMDEPCYIVEPQAPGTELIPNGLPIFTLYYANDDDALRRRGSDSSLMFTAPAAGRYFVRVRDTRGFGGPNHWYRLRVRQPMPDFSVRLASATASVSPGGGIGLQLRATRVDGFDDAIAVEFSGVPEGYSITSPVVIEAGHDSAEALLSAAADAKPLDAAAWSQVKIVATAQIGSSPKQHAVGGLTAVTLKETKVLVSLEPADVSIAPGQTVTATLKVNRVNYKGEVPFDVGNLPHGVIVDNIGLNGILIPANKDEQTIFLTAADWVEETDRPFYFQTKNFRGGTPGAEATGPVMLHVREPATVASSE